MRIGFNPNKDKSELENPFFHQVVIPVYIPNQEGYFKDSFQILKYCLESLFKTSHNRTFFTVINNGSCKEIITYLNDLLQENKIHELIHTTNIGKLNAILKGVIGNNFDLITITDADVLFLNNWQSETYKILENFPKAGVVSPTPSPKVFKHLTYNSIANHLFSSKLKFTKTKNPNALQKFADSIGNPIFYNQHHFNKNLTISYNTINAVIGAGHFVATYKGSIFDKINIKHTDYKLGGDSEHLILDQPAVDLGLWRLSTEDNYAFHLGNVFENWMEVQSHEIENRSQETIQNPKNAKWKQSKKTFYLSNMFFRYITNKNFFWKWFFKHKGLNSIEIQEY